ncbi:hypothetical protein [Streptomyces sp. H27-S2]|uniref:hypothetical protein n=1 Tax=Streptomyces antarcticus TaxID=2996458 RepID=UPI00226E19B3|nr:hypothetical protein [Streptomyces sp. H27-S2]MCY0954152.1 hypothetical protein [Streptomyces sp. H27-S2]
MGNLGAYQDITVEAKNAGGVEELIKQIQDAAAKNAFPRAFVIGAASAAAMSVLFKAGMKRYRNAKSNRDACAAEATEQLKAKIEASDGAP